MPKGTVRDTILRVFTDGDAYGLEVMDRLRSRTGSRWSQGAVYSILRVLEREGLLQSYESMPMSQRGYRPRIYYRLTDKGRAKL